MNWFAIHTKPRQEDLAVDALRLIEIETFFPKLRRKKTIRRKMQWIVRPLFPRYIFARFDYEQSQRIVQYANGVARIIKFGDTPAIVDDAIIAAIRERAVEEIVTVQPPSFQRGDLVEIQDGPLRGLQGIFERDLSDSERVLILLECLAQGARVEVSREQLERITE
jgi:transcriptional antiterminator RfaH